MRTIIFPTQYEQLPIIALNKLYNSKQPIIPLSTQASWLPDSDISVLDNRANIGVASRYMPSNLTAVDKLLVTTSGGQCMPQTAEMISTALDLGVEVQSLLDIHDEESIFKIADPKISAKNISSPARRIDALFSEVEFDEILYETDIPIIAVGSLWGFANQAEIAAKVALEFQAQGYAATSIINSNDYYALDFFSWPAGIHNNSMDFKDKVLKLNHYIKWVTDYSKCQVLVIEIPGELVKQDNIRVNDLGYYAFMLTQAIDLDEFICCSPYTSFSYELYDEILNFVSKRYSLDASSLHVSNSYEVPGKETLTEVTFLNMKLVDKVVRILRSHHNNEKFLVGNLLLDEDFAPCMDSIIQRLTC